MNEGKEFEKNRISQEIENFYTLREKVYKNKRFRYENYFKRKSLINKSFNRSTLINNNINLDKLLKNIKKKDSNISKIKSKSFSKLLFNIENDENENIKKKY